MCVMYVNHDFLSQRKKKHSQKKQKHASLKSQPFKIKKKIGIKIHEQLKMLNHQFKANMHLNILWITLGEEN